MAFQEGGQRPWHSRAATWAFLFKGMLSPLGGTPRGGCLRGGKERCPNTFRMPSLAVVGLASPSRGAGGDSRMAQRSLSSVWSRVWVVRVRSQAETTRGKTRCPRHEP